MPALGADGIVTLNRPWQNRRRVSRENTSSVAKEQSMNARYSTLVVILFALFFTNTPGRALPAAKQGDGRGQGQPPDRRREPRGFLLPHPRSSGRHRRCPTDHSFSTPPFSIRFGSR